MYRSTQRYVALKIFGKCLVFPKAFQGDAVNVCHKSRPARGQLSRCIDITTVCDTYEVLSFMMPQCMIVPRSCNPCVCVLTSGETTLLCMIGHCLTTCTQNQMVVLPSPCVGTLSTWPSTHNLLSCALCSRSQRIDRFIRSISRRGCMCAPHK